MNDRPILTSDGSPTLYSEAYGQTYHSIHGAVAESKHVFIQYGLDAWYAKHSTHTSIHILEMGLGTGLNAALTHEWSIKHGVNVRYTAFELYPIHDQLMNQFISQTPYSQMIRDIYYAPWEEPTKLSDLMTLTKHQLDILSAPIPTGLNVIFYDAFSPNAQPELWSEALFAQLYHHTLSGGILTTYCAKGSVKRALKSAGWQVYSPSGPLGKREMTQAIKHTRATQ